MIGWREDDGCRWLSCERRRDLVNNPAALISDTKGKLLFRHIIEPKKINKAHLFLHKYRILFTNKQRLALNP